MIREDLDKMAKAILADAQNASLEEKREAFKVVKDFYRDCEMLEYRRKRANLDEPDEKTPTFADFAETITEEPHGVNNDARVTPFHRRPRA